MAAPRFHETQHLHLVFVIILLVAGGWPVVLLLQGAPLWPTLVPVLVAVLLVLLFMPLRTTLKGGTLRVAFGLVPLFVWHFELKDIESVEAVTYRPLRMYTGWGMRRGFDGSRALTMRGNKGVMLHLRNGKRYLIGSQKPEELAAALGV